MRFAIVAAAFAALLAAGSASAAPQPQVLTVVAHAHSISAPGAASLRPGLVTVKVRDASGIPHGIGIIRLEHGISAARAAKIVGADKIPDPLPFALLGGVPQLQPGERWEATVHLTAGRYLLFDDGANQKGMRFTFTVRAGRAFHAAAPATVGTITMTDFKFGLDLPASWNGTGVVKIPNHGKAIHELTFVRAKPAVLKQLETVLSKRYPQGPPSGARIFYALGGTSPGETAYVHLHLPAGHYLAISLFPDPKTGKPQTALGMMSTLTVR
jgi:hypothetical protein